MARHFGWIVAAALLCAASLALAPRADAAPCGTVGTPGDCSITVGGAITYSFTDFAFVTTIASGGAEVLRSSEDRELDPGYLTVPEPIEFPTEGGRTAHALYYPPANRDAQGPAGERPPLVVASHGGPTYGVTSDLHVG